MSRKDDLEPYDCFNDPNWNDNALTKCHRYVQINSGWESLVCIYYCCNYCTCRRLKKEATQARVEKARNFLKVIKLSELQGMQEAISMHNQIRPQWWC